MNRTGGRIACAFTARLLGAGVTVAFRVTLQVATTCSPLQCTTR